MGKKLLLFLFFLLMNHGLSAQAIRDTIEVSRKFKTILIFPEDIAESIIGSDIGFAVDFPKEIGSRFNPRILKVYYDDLATEKENHTNLTVITRSGNLFDFILKLDARPKKLTWTIEAKMAVTNIDDRSVSYQGPKAMQGPEYESNEGPPLKPKESGSFSMQEIEKIPKDSVLELATTDLYAHDPIEYYRLRSYYMQFDKALIPRYFARKGNVFLWLKGVYYNNDELYIQFRLENKEGVDLDINFIKFFIKSSYRNASEQKIPIDKNNGLLFEYKVPKIVKGGTENHFVIVLKKFSLDNKKELLVELDEEGGNRNLSMSIGRDIINNPKRF
jgi:hypothetical protein